MPTFTGSSISSTYNRVIFRDSTESSAGSGCKIQFTSNDGASDVTSNLFLATDSIGIGTASPVSALDIRDGLTTGGSVLTLATKETSVVANDVLGRINFYAPAENTGGTTGDQRLPGASIAAVAQATFSNTVNSTALAFETGTSETAVGRTRMLIDEAGNVGIGVTPLGIQSARTGLQIGGSNVLMGDTAAGADKYFTIKFIPYIFTG